MSVLIVVSVLILALVLALAVLIGAAFLEWQALRDGVEIKAFIS